MYKATKKNVLYLFFTQNQRNGEENGWYICFFGKQKWEFFKRIREFSPDTCETEQNMLYFKGYVE